MNILSAMVSFQTSAVHVSFSKICFWHLLSAVAEHAVELLTANVIGDLCLQVLNDYFSRVLEKVTRHSAVNSDFSIPETVILSPPLSYVWATSENIKFKIAFQSSVLCVSNPFASTHSYLQEERIKRDILGASHGHWWKDICLRA